MATVALAVAQKPTEFATVGFSAAEKVLQAIIIVICVILLLTSIILLSASSWKSGLIVGLIAVCGLAGTIFWIRSGRAFEEKAALIKQAERPQQTQPYPSRPPYVGRVPVRNLQPRKYGRGEDIPDLEEFEVKADGGDCGCGETFKME